MPEPNAPQTFYLQWNLPNWITIVLMASIGIVVIGALSSAIRAYAQVRGDTSNG